MADMGKGRVKIGRLLCSIEWVLGTQFGGLQVGNVGFLAWIPGVLTRFSDMTFLQGKEGMVSLGKKSDGV